MPQPPPLPQYGISTCQLHLQLGAGEGRRWSLATGLHTALPCPFCRGLGTRAHHLFPIAIRHPDGREGETAWRPMARVHLPLAGAGLCWCCGGCWVEVALNGSWSCCGPSVVYPGPAAQCQAGGQGCFHRAFPVMPRRCILALQALGTAHQQRLGPECDLLRAHGAGLSLRCHRGHWVEASSPAHQTLHSARGVFLLFLGDSCQSILLQLKLHTIS